VLKLKKNSFVPRSPCVVQGLFSWALIALAGASKRPPYKFSGEGNMRVFGVTGGIATGKSTVTQMLAELGAPTISADAIARALLAPGMPTAAAVLAAFPACADVSGEGVNRRALAQIIFADAQARIRLEALMHPPIIAALQAQIAEWRVSNAANAAAAEIPLLFEAGLESDVDSVVIAACAEDLQKERLCTRDGISEAEAHRQIAAQWPLAEKIARADVVIATDGDLEDTRRQVRSLWESL
jgi:dephospho-CoA kinase